MAAPTGDRDQSQADYEMTVNEYGGKQSKLPSRMDIISPEALLALGEVLAYGAEKYEVNNWMKIPRDSHIGHVIFHALKALQGDERERFRHTWHMLCRAMFACHMDIVYGLEGVATVPEPGAEQAAPAGMKMAPWPPCDAAIFDVQVNDTGRCGLESKYKIVKSSAHSAGQEWMWRCHGHLEPSLTSDASYIVEPRY
jgi:hypothetical protein